MRAMVGFAVGLCGAYFAAIGAITPGLICLVVAVVAFETAQPTPYELADHLAEVLDTPVDLWRSKKRYYYRVDGVAAGPFTKREIRAVLASLIDDEVGVIDL